MAIALPEEELHVFLRRQRDKTRVVAPPNLADFLAETLDLAARLVPSQAGSLLLDNPARGSRRAELTFVALFGPAAERLVGMRVPAGEGIVGHAYKKGRTYATPSAGKDPHFFGKLDQKSAFNTRSVVAAPIRLEQTVCGVLELINRRGRSSFSERDVQLVELIAQYISRAILNAVDTVKQNELALRDDLTGLRNTRGLEMFLEQEVSLTSRTGDDLAVLFIDVDHLKKLNDRHGHRAGSEGLRRVGGAIESALRGRGVAFRFGGDEFVAVCPSTSVEEALVYAENIIASVKKKTPGPMRLGGRLPALSVSIGVATLGTTLTDRGRSRTAERSARLLTAADYALYRAKRAGRGRAVRATRRDDRLGR